MEVEMRTTVDLDDDVLQAAKEIARQRGVSVGKVVSNLVREALTRRPVCKTRHGIPLFPVQSNARVATSELINELRDDTP